ncbi:hypothetical protein KUTeg_004870 [Tegillarca granosa]|uniref:Coiled-coil protein 142 C-terminal domain-containing protein n=1 Tax=Tegillarca granosa TaxID=220873 RepID=A0ABQ9FJY4_TEGGR|nr:hypothetical protein KUTeg_004870 [Tegillarca granosa]
MAAIRVHVPGMDSGEMESNYYDKHFGRNPNYIDQFEGLSSGTETSFEVSDVEETVKLLRKPFQILNPGNHVSKRKPEHGSISFIHCRHVVGLGKQYVKLRSIMEVRARLEFLRDCLFRIRSVSNFVQDLENLVHTEYQTLYGITHNCLNEPPMSKLFCLNALCEDLRIHVGHWNNIKQRLHTDKWLQPVIGKLFIEAEHVKKTLIKLYNDAIYWMEKLILIGFKVFAHSNLATLTQEVLWSIARGLEDFNHVLNALPKVKHKSRLFLENLQSEWKAHCSKYKASVTNFSGHAGNAVRSLPFSKILNIIATERSKYAAVQTHRFFTSNRDFMKILCSGRIPQYMWTDEVHSHNNASALDTSDYHTATGSLTSISAAILRVGPVRAPDLSNLESPLIEFARQEEEFAEQFLLIVCNSTNILRKNDGHSSKGKHKAVRLPKSPSSSKPPKASSFHDTPVLSRSDSKKKSVSWGDSADSSIRSTLVTRYLDLLWKQFSSALSLCFYEPVWGMFQEFDDTYLGSVLFCSATVVAMLRHMMEHVCLKDMFPQPSVSSVLCVARKLHTTSALTSWDTNLCDALGSGSTDKCYPCPLANGDYSTKTGMLLRDAFQPLFSILQEDLKDLSEAGKDSSILVPKQDLDLCHATSLVCRLLINCQIAHSWCIHKSQNFLAAWSVGNFLLITQTDLKLPVDHSMYIEHVLETVLEPVIEGVSKLKITAQIGVISMATKAFCEAWSSFILKEKIKFSYIGAYQLGIDFAFMKSWLTDYISDEAVRSSILDLPTFRYFSGVILLLKKQPYHRRGSGRFREPCSSEDLSCASSSDVDSPGSSNDMSPDKDNQSDGTGYEDDIRYVSNMDDWLNLRVQGGSKSWRLPSCLNSPGSTD